MFKTTKPRLAKIATAAFIALNMCIQASASQPLAADVLAEIMRIQNDETYIGDAGRLYVPECGYSAALYEIPQSGKGAQKAVDAEDSAAFLCNYGPQRVVADHTHQGFGNVLRGCGYSTVVYLKTFEGVWPYVFLTKDPGSRNDGDIVWDSHGNSIYEYDDSGLTFYTCNEDWRHVTVAHFIQYSATKRAETEDKE